MPLLKVWPVSSGAWILPSSNGLCLSTISGRKRGRHPFVPLPHLLLALCPVQGRVFWPWPLHPAPVLTFTCLCSAFQACRGVSSLDWRSESSTQQTIYEISPCDIDPLQLNAHFHPVVRPLEFAILILGSAQKILRSVFFCGGWAVMGVSPHLLNVAFITVLLYLKRQLVTCEHFVAVPHWCRTGAG